VVAAAQHLEPDAVRARTEALYREYGTDVLRICRSLLRDRAEAEDAAQQVFLSAHRALLGGAVPREPLAWLSTIARRECWAREARVQRGVTRPPADIAGASSADVANVAIRNTEVAALWLAITDLPRPQREALLLREIRGLSYLQLGEALAVSAPVARSLLARARRKVRLRLHDLHTAAGSVPLVETLARLIATGINPAAPAARLAALGLVAGGAIIAPDALEHHVRKPVAITAPAAHKRVAHVSTAVPKLRVVSRRSVVAVPPVRPVSHHDSRRRVAHRSVNDGSNGDKGPSSQLSGDGGRSSVSSVSVPQTTAPVVSSDDHGSSGSSNVVVVTQSSGGAIGVGSHDGGGSSDGGSGSGGSHGGGSDGGGGGSGIEGG